MLAQNFHKYNLRRLVKRGEILYAPYKCELSRSFRDAIEKIFFGPRADLIGTDKILVFDRRGIKLRRDGTYM
jgi:hypothetical protein